jgi:hypothetical protein
MIHTFVLFLRALSLHMFINNYIYIYVHIEKTRLYMLLLNKHMLFHAFILPSYYFVILCLCFLHTQWKRNKAKSTLLNVTTDGSKDGPIHWHFSAFFLWNLTCWRDHTTCLIPNPKPFWRLSPDVPKVFDPIPMNSPMLWTAKSLWTPKYYATSYWSIPVHTGPTSFSWSAECLKLLSAAVNGFFLCCAQFWNGTIHHKWRF